MVELPLDRSMEKIDVSELLAAASAKLTPASGTPGWAGVPTLFGAPMTAALGEADHTLDWIAAGVPFDGTTSSRPGAAEGPRAVRTSSLVYSAALTTRSAECMTDMSTGREFEYAVPSLIDVGDLTVFPSDPIRTMIAVAAGTRAALERARRGVFLIGDHSGTLGTFMGFYAALRDEIDPSRMGFVNIDHHFDFGDTSTLHGPIYHGSNSRRISELPGLRPENMAFVGVGDVTRSAQLASLRERGFGVVAAPDLHRSFDTVDALVERLGETCDAVYISTDIDVMDCSVAPGTGNVTLGGLASFEMLELWRRIHQLPVRAFDIAEVAPRYDPTGRTAQIAARLVFEALFHSYPRKVDHDSI